MDGFWPVSDVLGHLAGSWRVSRSVRDLASGEEGRFEGTTVFRPLSAEAGILAEPGGLPGGVGSQGGSRVPGWVGPPGAGRLPGTESTDANHPPHGHGTTDANHAPGNGRPSGAREPVGGGRLPPAGGPAARAGLLQHESGVFRWHGVGRPAERTLLFLPGGSPGAADVRFADGRPFHGLDLTSGHHLADHPCAADLYRGEFTVLGRDHWRSVWRVRGPAKDLVLTTDYARED